MFQIVKEKPTQPNFIFDNKQWLITNEVYERNDSTLISLITFQHIVETCAIDPNQYKQSEIQSKIGDYWTYAEVIRVSIDGEFDDPEIELYQKNKGGIVDKGEMAKIKSFSCPLFVIEKMVKEAIKIDAKNRREREQKNGNDTE